MPNYQYSLVDKASDVPNCQIIPLGLCTVDSTVQPLENTHSTDERIVSFSNFIYTFSSLCVPLEYAPTTTINGLNWDALETGQKYAVFLILG
jgi:hypothetical protein